MPPIYLRAHVTARADAKAGDPIRFVASTANVARDGLIVQADGWQLDNYRKNPVFLWAHDYDCPPLGRAEVQIVENELIADVTFDQGDEKARQIEAKYRNGFLHAVSVGFSIEEIKPPKNMMGAPVVTQAELLEISGVPVPSDPDALKARKHAAEQADAAEDWQDIARDMTALYCFPLERPIRAWRASYHTLARSYAQLGKEPPERLSPEYLATLDTEALRGLFLEDEAEVCGAVFSRHEEQTPTALPAGMRDRLIALRSLCDALLTPEEEPTPEPVKPPQPADDDSAELASLTDVLNRWSTR